VFTSLPDLLAAFEGLLRGEWIGKANGKGGKEGKGGTKHLHINSGYGLAR